MSWWYSQQWDINSVIVRYWTSHFGHSYLQAWCFPSSLWTISLWLLRFVLLVNCSKQMLHWNFFITAGWDWIKNKSQQNNFWLPWDITHLCKMFVLHILSPVILVEDNMCDLMRHNVVLNPKYTVSLMLNRTNLKGLHRIGQIATYS